MPNAPQDRNAMGHIVQQDDDYEYLATVDEGLADAKAGRFVPYEKVRRWLLSWGTNRELPPPKVPQGR